LTISLKETLAKHEENVAPDEEKEEQVEGWVALG
jgi:hypothetical protein